MERDNMLFYKSFHEATRELPADDYKKCLTALFDYAMDGTEPDLTGVNKAIFLLIKPIIDKNNKRYEQGKKGGRPKADGNQTETKVKPNGNQSETKAIPEEEEEVEEEVIKDISMRATADFIPPTREQIEIECIQNGYALNIDYFLATYEAQGWKLGNGQPIEDWKALLKKWNLSRAEDKGRRIKEKTKTKFADFKQHDYDFAELTRRAKA